MTPAAATNPRVAPAPSLASSATALLAMAMTLALGSCAGSKQATYTPGDLDGDQKARCRAVAQAFVDGTEEYPKLRDELRQDPVATAWFVRYLEHEIVRSREGRAELLSEEVVRIDRVKLRRGRDPSEWNLPGQRADARAIDQVVAIGEPAVETVLKDLLLTRQEFLRTIGIEILAGIGDAAVPRLLEIVRDGEPDDQRLAARALGAIGARGPALAALRELRQSSHWRVRSSVAEALAGGGPDAVDLLVEMLGDEDAFVGRQAVAALGRQAGKRAAMACLEHLETCKRREDFEGELAAQKALQELSGTNKLRSTGAWRTFIERMPAGGAGR